MADPIVLAYRGTPGESAAARGGFTQTLDVTGPPILTRQLIGANPSIALNKYRVTGEGRRTIEAGDGACGVRIMYDNANAEGVFGSKPFNVDLKPERPENIKQDKLTEIAWGMAMAGRSYLLGPKGEYRLMKPDAADAHGEALAVLVDAPVRLPADGVSVGQEWTTEWTGEGKHKETSARFHYSQTAVLQEVDSSERAHITFATTGRIDFSDKPSPQREETVLESKGTMVLDLKGGLPVMVDSTGTMIIDLKQASVKMVCGTQTRYEFE